MIKKSILVMLQFIALAFGAAAQGVEMAEGLRSEGKIFVVVWLAID